MEQSPGQEPLPLRIISLNVRFAKKDPSPGEQPWSIRAPRVCAQLRFLTAGHASAFVCLQEALHSQLQDLQAGLGPSWDHIGRGRADGKDAGEFSPVFYPTRTWRCARNETYWLSETPDTPSRGWDAVLNRVVTVGEFRHRQRDDVGVVVMSTHFDHVGVIARRESARLLLKIAERWSRGADGGSRLPVLLGGDFNSTPADPAYRVMTAPGSGMVDIADLVPSERRYGNDITFTSFGESNESTGRIDFLFVRLPEGISINVPTFAVLANRFDDGVYLSDHRPVVADVEMSVSDEASKS
jgi:endonuclease/exonuclease/phosphatase family metal-dependent hydrolase